MLNLFVKKTDKLMGFCYRIVALLFKIPVTCQVDHAKTCRLCENKEACIHEAAVCVYYGAEVL